MIEAILWDNDGVLVDTEEMFFAATRDAIATGGIELTREQYLHFALTTGHSAFDLLQAKGWTEERILALRRQRDIAYAAMLRGCRPMNGVIETLTQLSGTARMAVVTTSLREHFDVAHRDTGLPQFFELILAREDYENSKPHPEPYLTAMTRLGITADRCIAIEDSERGLQAAIAAGLRCIIVPSGMTKAASFKGALSILDDIRKVPALVKAL